MKRSLTATIAALLLALQPATAVGARLSGAAFTSVPPPTTVAVWAPGEAPDLGTLERTQFVLALYRDVLGRSMGQDQVQGWVSELAAGRSRLSVAEGFVLSAESLELIVRTSTLDILGRQPSPEEVATNSAWVRDHDSITELQFKLLGLGELHASMPAEAWITKAYRTLSGADPTADQMRARLAELAAGQLHSAVARSIGATPAARAWRFNTMFVRLLGRDSTSNERVWYAGQVVYADLRYLRTVLAYDAYLRRVQRWMYECYARALYDDVLGRPAEGSGVGAYAESLVQGRSAKEVVTTFVRSSENTEKVIRAAFTKVLGRAPSTAELAEHSAVMIDRFGAEHWSGTEVLVRLLLSAEFQQTYQDRAWVQQAFVILLGRPAGAEELDGWAPILQSKGYAGVAEEIAGSEEARNLVVSLAYRDILGRAPDPASLAAWATLLGQPPANLAENEEFMEYAREVAGEAAASALGTIVANALGLGEITRILGLFSVPDALEKARVLEQLAKHPLHDLGLRIRLLASDEYRARVSADLDPPTTEAKLAGTPGRHGWFTSAVSLALIAQDPAAGSCCASGVAGSQYRIGAGAWQPNSDLRLEQDGIHVVSVRSSDRAGNFEAERTVEVRIDATPPVISGAPTRPPNSFGWYRSHVTVRFTATDATSGLAAATHKRFLAGEGAGQSVQGRARDVAGNTAAHSVSGINIDRTAPRITISSPVAAGYPNTSPLVVQWSVADALSGIASHVGTLDGAAVTQGQVVDLLLMAPAWHKVSVRAADRAGNVASKAVVFSVTVDPAGVSASVERMREIGWITRDGTARSLQALLRGVGAAIERGDVSVARHKLNVLRVIVAAREGRTISHAAADLLQADFAVIAGSLTS